MKTVALMAQKGGPGKSTLAINLAVTALRGKKKSLLIDLDPQKTAAKWYQRRSSDEPKLICLTAAELPEAIKRARAARIDTVIIDTAGRDDQASIAAIKHADFCLVACRPNPSRHGSIGADHCRAQTAEQTLCLCHHAGTGHRLSQSSKRKPASAHHGTVAPVPIVYRVAYQDALGNGQSVIEYGQDAKAAREMLTLWHWLKRELRRLDGLKNALHSTASCRRPKQPRNHQWR